MNFKSFFLVLFCFQLFVSQSFSQSRGPYDCNDVTRIMKQIYSGTDPSYHAGSYDFGYLPIVPPIAGAITRSVMRFNLPTDFPKGAYIYKVELIYRTNYPAIYGDFTVNYISNWTNPAGYPAKWTSTDNATYIRTCLGSDNITFTYEMPDILTAVNDAVADSKDKIYLVIKPIFESGSNEIKHSVFSLLQIKYYYEIRVKHTIKNNPDGGVVRVTVDNQTVTPNPVSGYIINTTIGKSVSLEALEQSYGGYLMSWNQQGLSSTYSKWYTSNSYGTSHLTYNQIYSYATENDTGKLKATYTAYLKKNCNVTFQTTGTNIPNTNGTITISGGSSGTSPVTNAVIEGNGITATFPLTFWYNNILYTRTGDASQPITPYSHTTYSKTYGGRPEWPESTPKNLVIGKYLVSGHYYNRLTWTEHPNSNVTSYQIFRSVLGGSAGQIATVSRGTTSYIDDDYYWSGGGGSSLQISYSVNAYYSTEASTSLTYYQVAYGEEIPPENKSVGNEIDRITEYSLSNYPNPFNPTTRIEYQLPKAGEVTIKVYNSLGKEVATLVNGRLEEGKYTTEFNGSDLSSGMYFYVLRANEKTIVNKMLLIK